jgi:uncharacterized zinc-type alcohol dehydrogenase-like protein
MRTKRSTRIVVPQRRLFKRRCYLARRRGAHEGGNLNDIRAILGNDLAIKTYREGTLPFPDGSIIARLAWSYVPSEENDKIFGRPQSFVAGPAPDWHLQFLVKDAKNMPRPGVEDTLNLIKPVNLPTRQRSKPVSPAIRPSKIATLSSPVTHLDQSINHQTKTSSMNATLTQESVNKLKQPQPITASPAQSRPGTTYKAWVAKGPKQPMVLETVDLGPLGAEDVEVAVENCGLCHTDISILNNDWGISQYPAILGHEATGRITALGPNAKGLKIGQRVGVGSNSGSCMHCHECMSGSHHLCPEVQPTIVGHRGGFASHIRSHWAWATPLPEKLNFAEAGPLLCGGVTVFAPLTLYAKPTDRVGIIGIGGLGHMAVKFAAAYGCDVTAFTSSESKFEEAKGFGANHVLTTKDSAAIKKLAGRFNLLISTVNVKLDWDAIIGTLAPKGRLHVVGVVPEPIPVAVFSLIMQQRSVSGSPSGSPTAIESMLDFASRHNIAPQTEHFPMSKINEAFARLESGKARYRIVLDADF